MPQLTNKYNLPESLESALAADWYVQSGDISVTGLIQPPRLRQLMIRYNDQVQEDISDRIWMLLGSAVHDVLERADTTRSLQEERLSTQILGWTISGKADIWENETLTDYKITSVWAGVNGPKPDWIAQCNIYKYLYEVEAGFPVKNLQIVCIYRDWSKGRAKQGGDYPPCAAGILPVPVWDNKTIERYIIDRIQLHRQARVLSDIDLPDCTSEERWEKPTQYAVMKQGRKSAVRVLDTYEEAEAMAEEKGKGHYVETRPGRSVRCQEYCAVQPFCNMARTEE